MPPVDDLSGGAYSGSRRVGLGRIRRKEAARVTAVTRETSCLRRRRSPLLIDLLNNRATLLTTNSVPRTNGLRTNSSNLSLSKLLAYYSAVIPFYIKQCG